MSHLTDDCTPTAHSSFVWPVRVYYEDTDASGVVYHASYLRFMERARSEWLRSLGLEQTLLRHEFSVLFTVYELHIRYHQPARLDQALAVSAQLGNLARASFSLRQCVRVDASLISEARVDIACVDATTFRPKRLPQSVATRLQKVFP
jgi:acyl-CoA thioester hydrolase